MIEQHNILLSDNNNLLYLETDIRIYLFYSQGHVDRQPWHIEKYIETKSKSRFISRCKEDNNWQGSDFDNTLIDRNDIVILRGATKKEISFFKNFDWSELNKHRDMVNRELNKIEKQKKSDEQFKKDVNNYLKKIGSDNDERVKVVKDITEYGLERITTLDKKYLEIRKDPKKVVSLYYFIKNLI
jgi:hypothetical protein